jgi:hypothetical protein
MFQSSKVEIPLRTVKVTTDYKPASSYFSKSVQYLLHDRRKLVSLIVVLLLPVITNIWRFIPEYIEFPVWVTLQSFIYHFFLTISCLVVALAWYFNVHRKDYVQQIIVSSVLYYGIFLTFTVLPIADDTPLWLELIATLAIFFFVYLCITHIRNYYLDRPMDYKMLHDGLIHDLHHQRFMGSINRIEGLIHVAKMEEPYKELCEKELEELKKSVAYIADKYNDLA